MSCLLRGGFLFPIKLTQVSSYVYGTLYPLVKHTRTGHAKGEPFRQNLRATGYSPLGRGRVADAGFQPCGQIFEMSAPSALDRRIVAIPVLTCSYARVSETQACPIVLPRQCKGDRSGISLKGFPTIAEAVRRLTYK